MMPPPDDQLCYRPRVTLTFNFLAPKLFSALEALRNALYKFKTYLLTCSFHDLAL